MQFFEPLSINYLNLKRKIRERKRKKIMAIDRGIKDLIETMKNIDDVFPLFSCSGHLDEPISTYIDFVTLKDDFYDYIKEGLNSIGLILDWELEKSKNGTISLRVKNNNIVDRKIKKFIEKDLKMWKNYIEKYTNKENQFDKISSVIDYPYSFLPKELWKKENEKYKLKPKVRKEIIRISNKILNEYFAYPGKWIKGILIISSAATQFYSPDGDLDIKIVADFDKLIQKEEIKFEGDKEDLRKILLKGIREKEYTIEGFPLDFYILDISELPEYTGKKSDSVYDVLGDEWIKEPPIVDIDKYDREKVINRAKDEAIKWAQEWDLDIGKIKRSVSDYENIKKHLSILSKKEKKKFKEEIEKILADLENEIENISKDMEEIIEERHKNFQIDFTPNIEEYYFSLNWMPKNIQFKLLQKWGYLKLISDLQEVLKDDEKVTEDEIDEIKKVVGISKEQTNKESALNYKQRIKQLMEEDPLLIESIIGNTDVFFPIQTPTKEKINLFIDSISEKDAKEWYDYIKDMNSIKIKQADLQFKLPNLIQQYQKHFPSLTKEEIKERINLINQADPTKQRGVYTSWLVKLDISGTSKFPEDTDKIKESLELFEKIKNKPNIEIQKDIMRYETYGNLAKTIEPYEIQKKSKQKKKS